MPKKLITSNFRINSKYSSIKSLTSQSLLSHISIKHNNFFATKILTIFAAQKSEKNGR